MSVAASLQIVPEEAMTNSDRIEACGHKAFRYVSVPRCLDCDDEDRAQLTRLQEQSKADREARDEAEKSLEVYRDITATALIQQGELKNAESELSSLRKERDEAVAELALAMTGMNNALDENQALKADVKRKDEALKVHWDMVIKSWPTEIVDVHRIQCVFCQAFSPSVPEKPCPHSTCTEMHDASGRHRTENI